MVIFDAVICAVAVAGAAPDGPPAAMIPYDRSL